jgi:hypothetical protein
MAFVRFATFMTVGQLLGLLAGCAGGQADLTDTPPQAAPAGMAGRWFLSAPNAPPCGISLSGAPGAQEGRMSPEGGCPGRFFLSRRWSLAGDTLTISDDDGQPLGTLKRGGDQFEGEAVTGMKVSLAR